VGPEMAAKALLKLIYDKTIDNTETFI